VIAWRSTPPIRGLGTTSGPAPVRTEIGSDYGLFAKRVGALIDAATASGKVTGVVTGMRASIPQYAVDIDRTRSTGSSACRSRTCSARSGLCSAATT
jgi:hypothetical protein